MKITYFAEKSLAVELMYKKEDEWTKCFEVQDIKLPSVTYLGFSAETGELSDNHDIIKVETKNLYNSGSGASPQREHSKNKYSTSKVKKSEGGGWGWFFFKFILFGFVVAGSYAGFTVYRASKRRDRF